MVFRDLAGVVYYLRLVAWAVVHARWRGREVAAGPVFGWTLALIGAATVALFPPVWGLIS